MAVSSLRGRRRLGWRYLRLAQYRLPLRCESFDRVPSSLRLNLHVRLLFSLEFSPVRHYSMFCCSPGHGSLVVPAFAQPVAAAAVTATVLVAASPGSMTAYGVESDSPAAPLVVPGAASPVVKGASVRVL